MYVCVHVLITIKKKFNATLTIFCFLHITRNFFFLTLYLGYIYLREKNVIFRGYKTHSLLEVGIGQKFVNRLIVENMLHNGNNKIY